MDNLNSSNEDNAGSIDTDESAPLLSSLARQLSDAARRSADREARVSWNELRQSAQDIVEKVAGQMHLLNIERNDAQLPRQSDPVLYARARQATDFLNNKGRNPFTGMSRDHLAFIIYDEGGPFTENERTAAYFEAAAQESAWRRQFVLRTMDTYHRTGIENPGGIARQMLAHYNGLPQMERVQYPRTYEIELQRLVDASGSGIGVSAAGAACELLPWLNKWAQASGGNGLPDGWRHDDPGASGTRSGRNDATSERVAPPDDLPDSELTREQLLARIEQALKRLKNRDYTKVPSR